MLAKTDSMLRVLGVFFIVVGLAMAGSLPPIPGTPILGAGFNSVLMQLTGIPAITLTAPFNASDPDCTASQVSCGGDDNCWLSSFDNKYYMIPGNVCFSVINEGDLSLEIQVMANLTSYYEFYSKFTKSHEGRKTKTVQEERFIKDIRIQERIHARVANVKKLYLLRILSWTGNYTKWIHPITARVLADLPAVYSNDTNSLSFAAYRQAIATIGTDFVVEVVVGGAQVMESRIYKCYLDEYSESWVKIQTKYNYLLVSKSSGSEEAWSKIDKGFFNSTNVRVSFAGGDFSKYEPGEIDQWLHTIPSNPIPVQYKLTPVASLINDLQRRASWTQAVTEYETEMGNELLLLDASLKPLDPHKNYCQ